MKICFISPPYNSDVRSVIGVSSPPLGLAYLASTLRDKHEVKIIDSDVLGYGMDDIRRELKGFYPDIVGVTSSSSSIFQAYHVARIAKEVRDDCVVVIGGPHATFLPEQTLGECRFIDVVVRGEGEGTVRELVEVIENGEGFESVRGISFRRGDRVVSNEPRPFIEDIDSIPFPSRDLLPIDKYQFHGEKYTTILTSRGCPFSCLFCSSSRLFGGIGGVGAQGTFLMSLESSMKTIRLGI